MFVQTTTNPVMHVRNFSFSSRLAVIVTRLRNKNLHCYIVYCIITVFRHFQPVHGGVGVYSCGCISDSPLMAAVNYAVIARALEYFRVFEKLLPPVGHPTRLSLVGLISLLRRALNGRRIFGFIFGGFRSFDVGSLVVFFRFREMTFFIW